MNNPRFTLTYELADTILRVHNNGAFQIDCLEWGGLYQKARIVVAKQRVEQAKDVLQTEESHCC